MPAQFVNLNDRAGGLPATLAIPWRGTLYHGRVLHAEWNHYHAPTARRAAPRCDPHYHVVLVTGGAGSFDIAGALHPATPGRVFFTGPKQAHNFLNAGTDTTRYAEITFEMVSASGALLDVDFHTLLGVWTNQPTAPLLCADTPAPFRRLFGAEIRNLASRAGAAPPPGDLELSWLLTRVLRLCFDSFFAPASVEKPDALTAVRDHIRAHFRDALDLPSLAQLAGLTPNYLARRFAHQYGRSPISYLIDVRMHAACQILRVTGDSLQDVAQRVGIDDVYYFSRLFRKRVGVAPGRYRDDQRKESLNARGATRVPPETAGKATPAPGRR